MWSQDIKLRLLKHLPHVNLVDIYGASEASGLGYSVTNTEKKVPTGMFEPGPKTVLVTPDDRILGPGEPGEGMIARSEPLPLGYFQDPKKTAEVFREIGGVRYALPGDWARREASGLMMLVGRGNMCINTGGEKVFAEEVEEALKLQHGVEDTLVVGVPDETWGKAVVALVKLRDGASLDEERIRAGLRQHLANYKLPKKLLVVPAVPRSDSGKADYAKATALATSLAAALTAG
jgi:fatty-acyl-CoA synthase